MQQYVDAQRQMLPGDGVPCFFQWRLEPPVYPATPQMDEFTQCCTILAVEAMVGMASAIGQVAEGARYKHELAQWRKAYDTRFWEQSTGTYTSNQLEVQTITSTALGAKTVPVAKRSSAVKALATDVASRGYHLTVGSVGQKWLLGQLTANGHHDSALKLAMQTSYPSWGHWISQGQRPAGRIGVESVTNRIPGLRGRKAREISPSEPVRVAFFSHPAVHNLP